MTDTPTITPVILSGGSGTRLWPLSLDRRPKQLQSLVDDHTMIQSTVERTAGISGVTPPMVICNAVQVEIVAGQLADVGHPPGSILVEPVGRNTAPAVAAAALLLEPEVVMAVLPADHVISDVEAFRVAMLTAGREAEKGGIVTFGVVPTRPDTGFGYIEVGLQRDGAAALRRFVEKPELQTAEGYVNSGRYLWNSGMFVFTAGAILSELERFEPELVSAVAAAVADRVTTAEVVRLGAAFAGAKAISIDHAVMERTQRGVVVSLDAGWSDVGSWEALWEATAPDGETVTIGPVHTVDVARSYVRSEGRPIAVIGLDDVVVVETPDAILVMDRRRAQEVRSAAEWFTSLAEDAEA